jgi:heme/copper-type cytochrome/quinol oxidase subunit 4
MMNSMAKRLGFLTFIVLLAVVSISAFICVVLAVVTFLYLREAKSDRGAVLNFVKITR